MVAIAGNITEALDIIDWRVTATKCKDGTLSGTALTGGATYSVTCADTDPVNVTLAPKIDYQWSAAKSVLVNDYVVAASPDTTPHIWKATTVPSGDANYSSVSLLLHCDGANGSTTFTDDSPTPKTFTAVGSVAITTSSFKYGTGSLNCGAAGSNYITTAANADFVFGTGDLTVEGWFKPSGSGTECFFFLNGVNTAGGIGLAIGVDGIRWRAAGSTDLIYSGAISSSVFSHITYVRNGNTRTIYLNGTSVATDTLSFNQADNTVIKIGASDNIANDSFKYYGLIDDLRITKGVARYTANFTAPTEAFIGNAGFTGATEPTWNISGTTSDNGITWTYVAPLVDPVTLGPKIPA